MLWLCIPRACTSALPLAVPASCVRVVMHACVRGMQVMGEFQAAGPAPSPLLARRMDGALLAVGCMVHILKAKKPYKEQLGGMMATAVMPCFASPYGHLRSKAVWVAGVFCGITFPDGQGQGGTFLTFLQQVSRTGAQAHSAGLAHPPGRGACPAGPRDHSLRHAASLKNALGHGAVQAAPCCIFSLAGCLSWFGTSILGGPSYTPVTIQPTVGVCMPCVVRWCAAWATASCRCAWTASSRCATSWRRPRTPRPSRPCCPRCSQASSASWTR